MAPTVLLECTKEKELKRSSFGMAGKKHKFSRGYPSGFVPDYRHAAETMGESEGFGGSNRVDSDYSSAPKRKCISLNVDKSNGFNVPLQVISLSKLSGSDRKELEMRLRAELEQIQTLQKRINSRCAVSNSGVGVSPSSNGQGKRHDTTGHRQNVPQPKRGISGRFESLKPARPPPVVSSSDMLLMKQCEQVLKRLMSHQHAWVFNIPVDTVKLNIPDYFSIIKQPMDLGTIKRKLASGGYTSPWAFVADVRLTFTNAMTYNPPANDVHIMADQMSKWFEQRWKPIEKKLSAANSHLKDVTVPAKMDPQPKKRKVSPPLHSAVVPERLTKPDMTPEEKQSIGKYLEATVTELPDHIIEFLRRHGDNGGGDEIEIDIDSLNDDILFALKKLLDDYKCGTQREKQVHAEPCEMEVLNESGLSNSSMHPCKGNEPADEDIDIGGNDPPISNYPPVVIEKDIPHRSSKCSSSSSSSSDSDSSSSDSDSGSSSESESDNKAASPTKTDRGSVGRETNLDQERSEIMNPLEMNRTVNESDNRAEQDGHDKPVSVDTDGGTDGENAPNERQVSPEKLYRAALLRSRFADTILKAREKTVLDKSEKVDPDQLRKEREELERQQREERVRLQEEARVAEEARNRAEAEAAAEAKRKRELEREAARQALLKIEKTVEINENSIILKDLEMLRSVPGGPISVDETSSTDQLPDGMGGFNLEGNYNLERLGLFMKEDEEEEEEEEEAYPSSVPANDAEEGEMD